MSQTHAALRKRLQAALGEEYTVGELLGEGGFAVVFRARDNALKRDVAVKVLDLKLAPSPTLAERFVREAQTVARLEHPQIVPIYKVGGRGEVLYLIMRCVDGPSLRKLLEKGSLSVGDAARIARQVADALAYAHSHGLIHRDVKPDNVLLDRTGHVLVTDFGIAKAAAQAAQSVSRAPLTTEGMILGTPHYMSPEQSAGERLDPRSDIYSLGVVLYHMLAGTPPFDGDSAAAILAQHISADPTPIREVRREVPDALAFVLDRMLAKDPDRRYPSAGDASRALVEALPTAAHDRLKAPVGKRVTRSLVGVGLAGCLAFVAFVAGGALVLSAVTSDAPRLSLHSPGIPDSLGAAYRAMGALGRGERLEVVFVPHGGSLQDALLLAGRRLLRVTPRGTRGYPADSIDIRTSHRFGLRRGLRTAIVLVPRRGRVDTLFQDLSVRELYEMRHFLARGVARGEPAGEGGAGGGQRSSGRETTP